MTPDDDHVPVRLDRNDCLHLLENETVGRLAIIQGDRPTIFPVNYVLDGDSIVFRTSFGTKLLHGRRSAAAFEIDGLDHQHRTGWSVVVAGLLDEITAEDGPLAHQHARGLDLRPWASGARDHWMRLVPRTLTGRRVGPAGTQC